MNTAICPKSLKKQSRRERHRQRKRRHLAVQTLQPRELMAADFSWDGDVLKVSGTDSDDFIAVQTSEFGTQVVTDDAFISEFQGRPVDSAASIEVFGGGGNDMLFSYRSPVPVSLMGENGDDFLYSDNVSDLLDGGEGSDWVYSQNIEGTIRNAFRVKGLDLNPNSLNAIPQFDENNLIKLQVEVDGEVNVAGTPIDLSGMVDVGRTGVGVELTGSVATWDDAFGIPEFDLHNTSLTLGAGHEFQDGNGYRVQLQSSFDADGTEISIDGAVEMTEDSVSAEFTGTVADWDDAFGIDGLDLQHAQLSGRGSVDADENTELGIALSADMLLDATVVDVAGEFSLSHERIEGDFTASVENWDDAFGIEGLTLTDSQLRIDAYTDRADDYGVQIDLSAGMLIEDTEVDVSGNVEIAPERINAKLNGSVDHWNDAFGINGLTLTDSELNIDAHTDRADTYGVHIDLLAEMEIEDTNVNVTGEIDFALDRIDATLKGSVENWDDAFGIAGLTLNETDLEVIASSNRVDSTDLRLNLAADMDLSGTNVEVEGTVAIDDEGIEGTLVGTVDGQWAAALGVIGLNLQDTTLSVRAAKHGTDSELELGITAGMDFWGTTITVDGSVEMAPEGTSASLTGSVAGDWAGAFGIDALELRDTALTISNDAAAANELSISVDTDLQLFGDYIDVAGDVLMGADGPTISFSPPGTYGFVDLLGIPGFTLDDADLEITATLGGVEVAIDTTMAMGSIDVDFTGAFAVGKNDISASLTGRVDRWDNAFDVAGLNLDDIVMTLGAESGPAGASMFIGLGAGINIGSKELDVAGWVGFGSTGWEVAFRGEINSLTSNDLIDFANAISSAADPNAVEIPEGALGDFELRDAYINFAPKGGNADLGITDGFGIGGDFFEDGELLAGGEFEVDLEQLSFEVALEIPELDLGPVDLSDVVIDIRIATSDSYFKVAGTAELMGSDVHVAGEVYGDGTFTVMGTANINLEGMAATATFTVDISGISFEATAQGSVVNAIKGSVAQDLVAVAQDAQAAIDQAQAAVEVAKAGVRSLEADLADARAEAQREIDAIKADIASAKKIVDSIGASKNYWYSVRKSRYNSWRAAVSATNRSAWYNYAYYKGIEASRYASYVAAAGTYSAQVVAYNSALATYNGVKAAAGWALDSAGVEANPEVIRLNVLLTAAKIVVTTAESVLNEVEEVNADALQILNVVDSLRVDRITFSGKVETLGSAAIHAKVDYSFAGNHASFAMQADTDKLVEQLAGRLASAIL